MKETASPGPTATLPDRPILKFDDSDDSPLDDLSSTPSDGEESLSGAPDTPAPAKSARSPQTNGQHDGSNGTSASPLTNGHGNDNGPAKASEDADDTPEANGDERPAKRQRTRAATPPPPTNGGRKPKPISPPWKKIGAEGVTSFKEGGRRKSGRINMVPLELQSGDKRITRRAVQSHQTSPPARRAASSSANGHATRHAASSSSQHSASPSGTAAASRRPSTTTRASAASSARSHPSQQTPSSAPSRPPSSRRAAEPRTASRSARRSSPMPNSRRAPAATGTRAQPSRSSRQARPQRDAAALEMPTRTTPRIRLRTRTLTIPIVHPDQTKMRPRLAPTLPEYFATADAIPVEDGGQFASEDDPRMTDEMAASEAAIIARIERETEAGGILTEPRCVAFEPEAVEEPPRQWAHNDHMVKAVANFRRLLSLEQQRHRAAAKRLAEACRDEWVRRQPKSAEQIEAEARAMWMGRYRIVMRALFGTWENVRLEINRRRVREWEAEEQRRVKAALQEAVALSEQKLQARRTQHDSEALSDDDMLDDDADELDDDLDALGSLSELGDADGSASGSDDDEDDDDDESNMSSSDDDEGDDDQKPGEDAKAKDDANASDEGLTQEQLRQKYANLPDLDASDKPGKGDAGTAHASINDDETSDESVDMDDDLGSSEMDSDDDDDDGDDGDESDGASGSDGDNETESDEDEQAGGLLGMLFGKSELQKLKAEPTTVKEEEIDVPRMPEAPERKDDDTIATLTNGDTHADEDTHPVVAPLYEAVDEFADDDDDVAMVDMPSSDDEAPAVTSKVDSETVDTVEPAVSEPAPAPAAAPAPEPASAPADTEPAAAASPETDAVTTAVSLERSQSPRTLDTKPSELDTPMSTDADAVADATVDAEASKTPEEDVVKDAIEDMDMDMADADADVHPSNSKESAVSRSVSLAPTASGAAPKTEIPFLLRGNLREYQHYGLDWLAGLYANRTNGILADEMGLGKTIQTIALLAHLACHHEVWGPHLVIVPTSVILNWEMEFKKWCPAFKILTYYGSQDERKRKRIGWNNNDIWNVCITSYQIVVQDQQVFKRRRWHYMILDEAHNIKNFKSQRWQSLLGFNTQARLLLTGTPLQNNLTELWSLLFFLMPPENGMGGFADLSEFHDWFHKPESQILESGREEMDEEARAIIAKLHKVLRPYLLRRLKADVEKQMPAKYEHVELCRLSKRQRELYDGFLARSDTRASLASGNYLSIINCLMQLRKVCNHPDLFVDRPIMTSFRMQRSIPASYETTTEQMVRRAYVPPRDAAQHLLARVSLPFLNLVPTLHETSLSGGTAARIHQLAVNRVLADLKEAQRARLPQPYPALDGATVQSNLAYLENAVRWRRYEELQHGAYVNALRRQQRPVYGQSLLNMLTLDVQSRPFRPRPRVPAQIMAWFENDSFLLHNLVQPLERRSSAMEMLITKFACVTPAVVTCDMNGVLLGRRGAAAFAEHDLVLSAPIKRLPFMERQPPRDPWHEARMRLTIQFPDKRLLQYDCGKLQALDRLLRRLQAGGHRALIFTQMTKVLDILEQFLNIHGHKYLRLDGATRIEQRQILTDRFNHDNRILCFILSTRSGGLGINLTGADTVIFYDQDWNPAMDKQCQDRCHRIGQTRDVHIYRLISEHTIEANILRKASQKQMLDDVVIQEGEFTTDYFNKMSVKDMAGDVVEHALEDGTTLVAQNETTDGIIGRFHESNAAANAAMDRVLGGVNNDAGGGGGAVGGGGAMPGAGRVLEQAEDTEDVAAARLAEKEILQDDADFSEKPAGAGTATATATAGTPVPTSGISSARQATPAGLGLGLSGPLFDPITGAEIVAPPPPPVENNAWGGVMHTVDDYMLRWMSVMLEGTALELPKDRKKSKKKRGKDTRKR
ncbi:helicase SWR1 [Sporothrix schenckii 1099-18]|uniref:DNA helicase n=1 Tax=Sporothrix schenckii 1099-18 TaxID=1397361 RepID=A0A0F2M0X0_SPOSC|nr:helicase SWR1 [Sporothrix schenckii 1099-18]KJR83358.1 helicase SWR1 [Sporothrix schenckii 1099-18]